jgi:RNA polymerase sigma-70 factor (ECF subfamily)
LNESPFRQVYEGKTRPEPPVPRDRDAIARELLALRCRAGDRAAFESLVRETEGRLFYFVRRLVRDEADAWDVLQQTWVRAVRGVASLDDPARVLPWLYRIARNAAFTHVRRRADEPDSLDGLDADVASDDDGGPAFDDVEAVHSGLDALSLPHREVLVLTFLNEMSEDDVATVLGVPPGTVKSRLHYAKRALRRAMDKGAGP